MGTIPIATRIAAAFLQAAVGPNTALAILKEELNGIEEDLDRASKGNVKHSDITISAWERQPIKPFRVGELNGASVSWVQTIRRVTEGHTWGVPAVVTVVVKVSQTDENPRNPMHRVVWRAFGETFADTVNIEQEGLGPWPEVLRFLTHKAERAKQETLRDGTS